MVKTLYESSQMEIAQKRGTSGIRLVWIVGIAIMYFTKKIANSIQCIRMQLVQNYGRISYGLGQHEHHFCMRVWVRAMKDERTRSQSELGK